MASYKELLIEHIEFEVSEKSLRQFRVTSVVGLNRALVAMGIDHQVPVSTKAVDAEPVDEESVCREIVDMLTAPEVVGVNIG